MIQAHVIDGPNKEFAARLIDVRNRADMTQQALADKVGIDKRNISLYENGHARPRGETIRKLANALGSDPDYLADGHNAATQQYLAAQHQERVAMIPYVKPLFIEQWATLPKNSRPGLPQYNAKPSYGLQTAEAQLFVHWVATTLGDFRATRFPGLVPDHPEYPSESILIFDSSPVNENTLQDGDLVIFRIGGNENAPSLRRFAREPEPGPRQPMLLPLNPSLPAIPFDRHDITLIGVVIEQINTRKALLLNPLPASTTDAA